MQPPKAIFNWSGGKDSALALYETLQNREIEVSYLLTTLNRQYNRVSMHGVRVELLRKQAESIGIPLHELYLSEMPSMEDYNRALEQALKQFKAEGIGHSIFGDIFLEDLRKYREEQLAHVNMNAVFPIWKYDSRELINRFVELGFKAVLVCVNEKYLDRSFAGRMIDADFLNQLPPNVDPCGENGEYHSFVFDGPVFKKPVPFKKGEVVYRKYEKSADSSSEFDTGFFYCDLIES